MLQKKASKKRLRRLLYLIIVLFVLWNVFSAIQAYSLTHLVDKPKTNKTDVEFTIGNAIKAIVFGIDVPRPRSKTVPDRSFEAITIPADGDKTLDAWVMRSDSTARGMAIVFHGYVAEKSSMLNHAYILLDMGYDVLLVDFMGSNNSYGNLTTMGYLEAQNVKQAYDYATNQLHEKDIILVGFSMGAAAITKAQHDYNLPVNKVILEAPYGSMLDAVSIRMGTVPVISQVTSVVMTFWGSIFGGFNAFDMNPQEYVKSLNTPTLMLYGEKDIRIPQTESERIFTNIGAKDKTAHMFLDTNHEDYTLKHPEEWTKVVSVFLNED